MPTPRSSAIPGPPPANAWPGPPPGWSDEILLQQTEPVALSQPMPEAKNPAQSGAIVHGVISETDIPIRPRERRHDHVARSGGLPLPSAAAPRLPPKPPRPPRPSRRARKPDLEAKLQVAQRRQVSRKATDQNIRSARTFAWGALVPLAILVIGTGILLAAALIFWPAAHHEAVVTVLDAEAEAARQGIRSDTYQGYLAASDHLTRAIDATGPGGTDLAGITEGYLATLGVDDIERLKLAALGDQAETHAVLEVRFGHEPAPSSRKLLAQLDALGAQSPQIASARAWRMIGRGELEAALNQLETDILTYPSSANLHYLRGLCLDRMGDHDLARQAWERAQVSDARHVPTRVALGGWHARRRSQLASDLFADVLDRLSPGHPGATIDRAGYWIATGQNTRQAREELDRVLDATTALSAVERAQAHYVRGLWFQANREPTKASDEFDAALRLDPANPMASAARIRLLIEDDDLKAATASLNQAELRGGAAKALRLLRGLLNLRSGEPAKAKEALGQVDGLDKEAQSLLGDILVELGDWRGAEAAYTRAQTLGDKTAAGDLNLVRAVRGNADALLHLQADTVKSSNPATSWRYGRARLERGDLDTAVAHLRKAHRLDPRGLFRHRIPPVADLCRLHAARGEILAAKKACDEAIARRPSYEAPHRIRARVATLEGDDATAFTLLSALSARHPTDVGITLDLARAQIHQGRLSEANQSIEKLVERSEASADLHVLQGLLELHRYRHGFALGYFQRALAARDGDAEAHLYAARCLLHTGRPSAALEHIRAARKDKQWAVPALTAASEYHRRQGDWRAASREANRALRQARRTVTPSRFVAEAHTALAKALEMRYGATDPAVTNELQKAARLDHAPAFYHLARIALARRDRPTYLQALQDAADRDPFLCPAVALLRREVRENPKLDVRVPDTCR